MTHVSDKDVLNALAKAHRVMSDWMQQQASTTHERAERSSRFTYAHYLLFVQLRESLVATGLAETLAEEATKTANMSFDRPL